MINALTPSLLRENSPRDAIAQQATLNRATEHATSTEQSVKKTPSLLVLARNRLRNTLATSSQNSAQQAQQKISEDVAIRKWLAHINETDPEIIASVIEQCHADPEANAYFLHRAREVNSPSEMADDTNAPSDPNKRSQERSGGLIK